MRKRSSRQSDDMIWEVGSTPPSQRSYFGNHRRALRADTRTVERDAEYAAAIDQFAANVGNEVKESLLSGKRKRSRQDLLAIAMLSPTDGSGLGVSHPPEKRPVCVRLPDLSQYPCYGRTGLIPCKGAHMKKTPGRPGRLAVLRVLERRTRDGSEAVTTRQLQDGLKGSTRSKVYMRLGRLEEEGLVTSTKGQKGRRWSLSPQGRQLVEMLTAPTEEREAAG